MLPLFIFIEIFFRKKRLNDVYHSFIVPGFRFPIQSQLNYVTGRGPPTKIKIDGACQT